MTNNADVGSEDKKIGDAITTIGERLKYIYCGTIKSFHWKGLFRSGFMYITLISKKKSLLNSF